VILVPEEDLAMNAAEFIRNSSAMTPDQLGPYENQHVAWSEDGKQILASAGTLADLYATLDRQGLTEYVVGFIPPLDESFLGGSAG
jgi:hypothetical protein